MCTTYLFSIVFQAKKRLEEAIQLLQTAAPYFTMTHPSICACEKCSKETSEDGTPTQCQPEGCLLFELLKQTVKIAETYIELGIGQFEGYVHKLGKQVKSISFPIDDDSLINSYINFIEFDF